KIMDLEADELNQDDAFGQRQGDGATIGFLALLFEVHLGDLSGQRGFMLLLLLLPLEERLLVGCKGFPGTWAGEQLLRYAVAKLGELVEGFTQVRVASTENRSPLRCQGLGTEGFAAKDEVERRLDGLGRVVQVAVDQG